MAQNCWKNCTPMETGLGLALIVSITFLVIMILVYLAGEHFVSMLFTTRYYQCSKACVCLDQFSRLLFFPIEPHAQAQPEKQFGQSRLHESVCLGKNYHVAAVLRQTFIDDWKSFEYLCPAAILSSKWLISQNSFAQNVVDIHAAIGSKYWSKNGYLHRVEKTFKIIDVLIMLKLEVGIIIRIDFVDLVGTFGTSRFSVTTWNEMLKHEEKIEENFHVADNEICGDGTFCANHLKDNFNMTSSLAISNYHLYGFYNDTVCFKDNCVHRFITIKPYISYIEEYRDTLN